MNTLQRGSHTLHVEVADECIDNIFRLMPPSTGADINWHVSDDGDICVAHCHGFAHDVDLGAALAVRIWAALNYCRSVPTAHLIAHAAVNPAGAVLAGLKEPQ